ncbi:protein tesmin/TSO1-like CXC 2 isoform X1 [Syzygium oleosum]|uniref:protein tesmin/TSO1-like CXC 2 isoform X1 n=1 Tax=Syzygium oleosum TaxID=219896 RepID=UPI0024B9D531|nr:protein tesmin/TSO1-like CXC 2 isoform X1 [Syzygium oleosum]
MDTPERNQIAPPISKFEDSPVFNYINSLSPIKPVKSIRITQAFGSLTFASLPSIFTSPHVSSSHKESRFLRSHQDSDPSNSGTSCKDENKTSIAERDVSDVAQLAENESELQENFDILVPIGESSVEPLHEHQEFALELPQSLKYDCGSPNCNPTPCSTDAECTVSKSDAPFVEKNSQIGLPDGKSHQEGISQQKNNTGCEWETVASESTDLLIFSSPNDAAAFRGLIQRSPDVEVGYFTSMVSNFAQNEVNDELKKQLLYQLTFDEQHEAEEPSCQPVDSSEQKDTNTIQNGVAISNLDNHTGTYLSVNMDDEVGALIPFVNKPISDLPRGLRRRCLDFEMVGTQQKSLDGSSGGNSSPLLNSDENNVPKNKQLVVVKRGGDSSRCIVPGIGLHLNALTSTTNDSRIVKHEGLLSDVQALNMHMSTTSLQSPLTNQESLHKSLTSSNAEDMDIADHGLQVAEEASQAPADLNYEEHGQTSPRKKRRRLENGGESESCKRCNCKKSKCLKLYCECFAAGVYCIEPCACQDCFNKPIHEDTVLATRKQIESRNPLAFAPKVIRSSESASEFGDDSSKTPASARHKRGCNCKKSSCLKKYCECYQGGVGCSVNCRCEGCKNAFGTKDGSALRGPDCEEEEEEETEKCEKNKAEKIPWKAENQNSDELNLASGLPSTPSRFRRPLVQLAFPSKLKQPRSSFVTIGSSYALHSSQKMGKPDLLLPPPPKFEKLPLTNTEDEIPEILCSSSTPTASIKNASPNSKRVSPPHSDFGTSPNLRSGRRLILQSIPSFPSLTPQH